MRAYNELKNAYLSGSQINLFRSNMVVCTNIYAPNEATKQMVNSFERFGYEMAILNTPFPYGQIFNDLVRTCTNGLQQDTKHSSIRMEVIHSAKDHLPFLTIG
jgi:hypothetical protein